MNIHTLKIKLSQRLEKKLPGVSSQNIMLITPQNSVKYFIPPDNIVLSAVLILLFPIREDIHFFLTKRTDTVQYHKGQISLPGGAKEEGEELIETALRETDEEIGISSDSIQIIGQLTPLLVPVTGFQIHPFIGFSEHKPETATDPMEVESVFSVSIHSLVHQKTHQSEERTLRGHLCQVPYFHLNNKKVWGATSMILSEFKTVLNTIL